DQILFRCAGRYVHDGTLYDTLEAQCGLGVDVITSGQDGRVVVDEFTQLLAQGIDVRGAGPQYFYRCGIIKQRQEQVLYGDKFVSRGAGLDKGRVQADFKLFRNHASSITYRSGQTIR